MKHFTPQNSPRRGPRAAFAICAALATIAAVAPVPLRAQASFSGNSGSTQSVTPVAGEPLVGASSVAATSVPSFIDATTMPLNGVAYVTLGGSNTGSYTNTCAIRGGGGSGAVCSALISGGVVLQVIVTNPGSGYTSAPTVTVAGGSGQTFTASVASDMSDQLNEAFGVAYGISASGMPVDARGFHGTQAWAHNSFNNFPYLPAGAQATQFCSNLQTAGVAIQTAVTQVLPSCLTWDGGAGHGWPPPANSAVGTTIQPANGFTASTPIIDYGATNGSGSAPTDGIFLQNISVSCEQPNDTTVTGGIGICNEYAQEGSGGNHLFVQGCNAEGLYIFTAGTLGGAQNSGSWSDVHVNMTGVTTTAAVCLRVGNTTHATGPIEGFHDLSCVGQSSTEPLVGIAIDGLNFPLYDWHIENVVTGIVVAANNNASAILVNGHCVLNVTTCVSLSSAHTLNSADISSVSADPGSVTNVLVDSNINGGTAPTSVDTYLAHYSRQSNNHVYSTLSSIPSTNVAFACAPQFSTSDTLTNSVTTQQVFSTSCAVPANYFVANKALKVYVGVDFQSSGINSTFDLLACSVSGCGSGTVVTLYSGTNTDASVGSKHSGGMMFLLQGTTFAGASTALEATPFIPPAGTSSSLAPFFGPAQATQVPSIPTNGVIYLSFSITWSATTGTNSATLTQLATENLN